MILRNLVSDSARGFTGIGASLRLKVERDLPLFNRPLVVTTNSTWRSEIGKHSVKLLSSIYMYLCANASSRTRTNGDDR